MRSPEPLAGPRPGDASRVRTADNSSAAVACGGSGADLLRTPNQTPRQVRRFQRSDLSDGVTGYLLGRLLFPEPRLYHAGVRSSVSAPRVKRVRVFTETNAHCDTDRGRRGASGQGGRRVLLTGRTGGEGRAEEKPAEAGRTWEVPGLKVGRGSGGGRKMEGDADATGEADEKIPGPSQRIGDFSSSDERLIRPSP